MIELNEEETDFMVQGFKPRRLPQVLCALAATIGTFGLGTVLGWSSPAIPDLVKGHQLGDLTDTEKSWIGSLVALGAVFSSCTVGYTMQKIGRRTSMLALGIPFVAGWVLIAAAKNLIMILLGRFITGFCGGALIFAVPVYIAEIAEDDIRGTLSALSGVNLGIGIAFVYILGYFVSWVWLSAICSVPPLIFIACLLFAPESPRYLLEKGDFKSAALALRKLRGATSIAQIQPELKLIEKSIAENNAKPVGFKDLFQASVIKPFLITAALMFFQQLGGINAVLFYTVEIFKSSGSEIDPNISSIIIGCLQVVMLSVSAFLVDRAGRKILFIISEVGMTIGLFGLGVFFVLKSNNNGIVPPGLGWLPLACLVVYIVTYNIGMGSLPWVVMSELLPPHVKGLTGGLANSFCWILAFLITFTFADLTAVLGPAGGYFIFGAVSFVGILFAVFIVPETKGKSLDEIQALFTNSE